MYFLFTYPLIPLYSTLHQSPLQVKTANSADIGTTCMIPKSVEGPLRKFRLVFVYAFCAKEENDKPSTHKSEKILNFIVVSFEVI